MRWYCSRMMCCTTGFTAEAEVAFVEPVVRVGLVFRANNNNNNNNNNANAGQNTIPMMMRRSTAQLVCVQTRLLVAARLAPTPL